MDIPLASANKSVSAVMNAFIALLRRQLTRMASDDVTGLQMRAEGAPDSLTEAVLQFL
jgi:hypothetical protein